MASQSKVCFFFEVRAALAERTRLKKFIESIFKKENQKLQYVNYIFCSDKRVLDINRQFLKHDYYTDIITFDLSESAVITAEVYISVDRVRDNAKTLGVSFQQELHRVIFHGALHLCGYGDKTKKEREVMREKENLNLNLYK
jgi:rRNA maturation RNase YbeY